MGFRVLFPCSFIRSLEAEGTGAGSSFMIVYYNLPIMPTSRIVTGQPFLRNLCLHRRSSALEENDGRMCLYYLLVKLTGLIEILFEQRTGTAAMELQFH